MALTTAQQTRIDDAEAILTSAILKSKSETDKLTALDKTARQQWEYLFPCKGFESLATKTYGPVDAKQCESFVDNSKHPGCGTKTICEKRVTQFNTAYNTWKTQSLLVNAANTAIADAKKNRDDVHAAILLESNSDPEVIKELANIKAVKELGQTALKSKTTQIIIFSVVAVVIIVIVVKMLK